MYKAGIYLNNNFFYGSITFKVLKDTQDQLKGLGKEYKIQEILYKISELDVDVITAVVVCSIVNCGYKESDVCDAYVKDDSENILEKLFNYLNELFDKCLYKNKESDDTDDFEDEEDNTFLYKADWDCGYMEYVWFTILKRVDFWNTTPRNFFEQLEIHQNLNSSEKDKVEVI